MKDFLGEDFLLTTPTACRLYHDCAAGLPIVDYHCHVSPREIWEDRHFENLTELWLSGDHYKWRLMRANAVEERLITGGASPREKFQAFAATLPRAIGNPMYHWCHLELKNYFGYNGVLNGDTAGEVWQLTRAQLGREEMGVRGLIRRSNVVFIGTTDDPADSLEWHQKLAEDPSFAVVVAPTFRPDKALDIDKPGWRESIARLSRVSGVEIDGLESLKEALSRRLDYFAAHGCRASDHGLDYVWFRPTPDAEVEAALQKGLAGEPLAREEAEGVKTALLLHCAGEYVRLGWVMQLHFNCLRNPNSKMFALLGPDAGFDCIGPHNGGAALAGLLDALECRECLPRTILYSLDPGDNAFLDTLTGAFQGTEVPGKLQHGSAWWFNDHRKGMGDHLTSLANLGLLGNFVGMLTDSRSFLSYARHEYFRRILCELIGSWVERGEYPDDWNTLSTLVRDICCNNARRYFGLEAE